MSCSWDEISLAPSSECVGDCWHDYSTPFITFRFGNIRSTSGLCRPTHDNIVYIEFPHISLARVNAVATKQELESCFGELKITAVGEYLRVLLKDLERKPQFLAANKVGPYTITVTEPRSIVRQKESRKVTRKIILGVPFDLTDTEITDQISVLSLRLNASTRKEMVHQYKTRQ